MENANLNVLVVRSSRLSIRAVHVSFREDSALCLPLWTFGCGFSKACVAQDAQLYLDKGVALFKRFED